MTMQLLRFENCPACNSETARARVLFSVLLFETRCNVCKCANCGLVYKDHHPSESQLSNLYSADYAHFQPPPAPGPAEINSLRQKLRRCLRLMAGNHSRAELRVLDVGCGTGDSVKIVQGLGYRAEGIDPYLPARLENRFLKRARLPDLDKEQFDIVLLLNVAEHVIQPRTLFASARRVLRPGGVMLVTCPLGESAALRIHRERWTHLALDEHLLFWTPRSLGQLLAEVGFKGPSRFRIAGSPFPFGVAAPTQSATQTQQGTAPPAENAKIVCGAQERIWAFARWVQRSDGAAVAIQTLVHTLRLGDYLEYAASAGEA